MANSYENGAKKVPKKCDDNQLNHTGVFKQAQNISNLTDSS